MASSFQKKVFDAQVMTGNATTTSDPMPIKEFTTILAHITAGGTGTLAGTVKLQGSNGGDSWLDITSATATLATTDPKYIQVSPCGFGLVRAVVTHTSGTSTITCMILAKEG